MRPLASHHPWLRKVLIAALVLVALLALTVGVGVVWLHGEGGRRYLARHVESFVNRQMRGRLSVGAITKLTRRGIVARDVRFTSPESDEVIAVRDVDLEVRWSAMFHGRFISPRARVTGGRVALREHGDSLTIDETFQSPPGRPPSRPATGPQPSTVVFERIDVADVTLVATVHGVPDARVSDVHTVLSIDVRQPGGLPLLMMDHVVGGARLATPIPIHLRFTDGTFRFDSGSRERARANLSAMLGDHHVRLRSTTLVGHDGAHVSVHLTLPPSAGPLDSFATIAQANIADLTSSHFDFSVTRE